jgi:poly-beta-hydroxybutyrate-responsive repressor
MVLHISEPGIFLTEDLELSKPIRNLHVESRDESYRRGNMSEEERKQGGNPRSMEGYGIDVRPKNWLMPVILVTLKEWNSYGYKLMEQAAAFGYGTLNPGTLYRTLRNMEKNGHVKSEWDTSNGGGPARRVYSITDAGEAYLDFWAVSLEQYQRNIDAFFRIYTGRPARVDQQKDDE